MAATARAPRHWHRPERTTRDGVLYLNPGSGGDASRCRRLSRGSTCALLAPSMATSFGATCSGGLALPAQ